VTANRIDVSEADLREFVAAAEEVRDEGRSLWGPLTVLEGDIKNVLEPATEDRFQRALDALKFDLHRGGHRGG
jgi:hypothetical protein